jgi:hypothetical protein
MTTNCKKPGVAFWATAVVVVVLVAYPLSFGPACAYVNRGNLAPTLLKTVYAPCLYLAFEGPVPIRRAFWFLAEDICGDDSALRDLFVEHIGKRVINY